ncbi:TetR/AcrR family transcriptional regulator [Skermania piniformis]
MANNRTAPDVPSASDAAASRESPAASRESPAGNAAKRRADKIAGRRDELARATLRTLAELGYARTSLREIAANSEYSHGVLHYYFIDKVDLISHCVRLYKTECVARYDDLVAGASEAGALRSGFAERLAQTLVDDNEMHRLWYDLRSQSMFEQVFAPDVQAIDTNLEQMIWRVVERYAELSHSMPTVDARTAYAALDGLFVQALVRYSHGTADAPHRLREQAFELLPRLIA